jgi:hypothetical protein
LSKPPKRKSSVPEFPNPDKRADKERLRKDIREVLLLLRVEMKKGAERNMLAQLASVVHPGSYFDESRLPYYAPTGITRIERKSWCVLALASKLILDYWNYALSDDDTMFGHDPADIKKQLETLREVVVNGLAKYKINGNPAKGYTLKQ